MNDVEYPEDRTYVVLAVDGVNVTNKSGRSIIKLHVNRSKLSY